MQRFRVVGADGDDEGPGADRVRAKRTDEVAGIELGKGWELPAAVSLRRDTAAALAALSRFVTQLLPAAEAHNLYISRPRVEAGELLFLSHEVDHRIRPSDGARLRYVQLSLTKNVKFAPPAQPAEPRSAAAARHVNRSWTSYPDGLGGEFRMLKLPHAQTSCFTAICVPGTSAPTVEDASYRVEGAGGSTLMRWNLLNGSMPEIPLNGLSRTVSAATVRSPLDVREWGRFEHAVWELIGFGEGLLRTGSVGRAVAQRRGE